MNSQKSSGLGAFLRLWFVLFFSYILIKFLFDLIVRGWIEISESAFQEILLLPLGQSIVFWLVTRWQRRKGAPQSGE